MEDFRPSELPAVDTDVQLRLLQGPVSSAGLHLTQSADVDPWPLTSARPACDGGVAESRPCGAESCFLVFRCSFCSIKNPKKVRSCDGSGRKIRFKCKKKKDGFSCLSFAVATTTPCCVGAAADVQTLLLCTDTAASSAQACLCSWRTFEKYQK